MTETLSFLLTAPLALFLLGLLSRGIKKSWLAPSAFSCLLWSGFLAISLLAAPDFSVSPVAVWVIVLLVFCTQAGALLGEGPPGRNRRSPIMSDEATIPKWMTTRLLWFTLIATVLAMSGTLYWTLAGLARFRLSLSPDGLLSLGHFLALARYQGETMPTVVRVLLPWGYAAAFTGGMYFASSASRRGKILALTPFIPTILVAVAVAARAGLFMSLVLWLGGFLAIKNYVTRGTYKVFTRRIAVAALAVVAALLLTLGFILTVRYGYERGFESGFIWDRLRPALFGYLAAFSQWYGGGDSESLSHGAYTFAGVFDLLGYETRRQGIYGLVRIGDGTYVNIYTAFRGLIEDFSLLGAAIACFLNGIFAGWAFGRVCRGSYRWAPILGTYYAFIFCSPIIGLFTYNSPIFACLAGACLLAWPQMHSRTDTLSSTRRSVRGDVYRAHI